MEITQILLAKIKELAKKNDKPLKQVLSECELNRNFIYDLERRGSFPSFEKIYKLACYFNVSLDYISGRTENPEINK